MSQFKLFINLTRLNKPIGFMLLFWPCSWGLAYAYNIDKNLNQFLFFFLLFFLGSVLMRSAGCIVNDIVDKDIDKKVQRTKNRPVASNLISVKVAFIYAVVLCGLALGYEDKKNIVNSYRTTREDLDKFVNYFD